MGVGNRFVSAAVIMQINTAGNLFKYRNKRSPPSAGAARAAVIYDSSLGNVSAFAPSMATQSRFVDFILPPPCQKTP